MAITKDWLKTTKAQKLAWLGSEEGSYEDHGRARGHVYETIRGSYWASLYLDADRLPKVVKSFTTSTFSEYAPKHWKKLAPQLIDICEKFERHDLADQIREAARTL
jgi:hypothetical protein